MFPVAVMAGAGWLFLFVVLLIVPARRDRTRTPDPGDVPPAVVSLLARRLERSGFGATLVDLAARGWFELRAPAGSAGSAGPGGPALCVVAAETPGGPLTPFERRVMAHVALRAGARGEVPAPALSDGFGGGETEFMSAFREEVDAEARRLGLTRSRLSGRRIGLLLLLLFVPAGALIPVAAHGRGLAYAGGLYLAGLWVAAGVGVSRRRSASGQAVLDRWRSAVAAPPGSDGRVVAYAAALGTAPAALAVFAQGGTNVAWSSYRGGWRLLEIETNTWSWPWGCAVSVAIALGPVLYFAAAIWLGTHGMVLLAEEMTGLVVAAGIAGGLAVLARRAAFPRAAEFDGQVIRQWMVSGDSDSEDEYHVAIDDGTREKAWDVSVGAERYRRLPPGTFVHARVNLRSRADVTVEPVEPPAVAHSLAGVAADQVRAVTNGLPDPADLVLETEAAAILGGKVRGSHLDGAPGRTMVWQPPSSARPMLRVEVRHAADARRVPPTARPAPGVADGYLVSQGAAVTVSALTALISIHGSVHIASEASLAGLLPVVEGRLRELARRIDFNQY
ncbi:MAG TPA: hypothetical protein VHS30_21435 [Streptosporangiaceae bacterium]|nr:hypothetical protein [Streptosporangiaceae bacterium]